MTRAMKAALPAILIVVCIAWPALTKPAPDEVHWYSSLEEGTAAAKESGRPMLVDFWADWCAACKVMDRQVYSDPAFVEAARGIVTVRVNYDRKADLARKYNVEDLPTLVYTDSFGSEIFRHTGFLDGRPLATMLHSLPSDMSKFNRFDQILMQNKTDFAALKGMGEELRATGLFVASNEYYRKALDTREAKTAGAERGAILATMGTNSLGLKDGKQAADWFGKCLKDSSNGPKAAACTLGMANAYAISNKKDKAKTILEELVRDHPGTAEAQQAQVLLATL